MPAWVGPAISAASNIAAGLLGRGGSPYTDPNYQADLRYRWKLQGTRIRQLVNDAKKAGIHPLYALGASGYSMALPGPAGTQTGSQVGDALRAAGRGVERGLAAHRRQKLLDAETRRTDAETRLAEARAKSIEQQTMSGPRLPDGGIPQSDGSVVYPAGVKAGQPLMRGVRHEPHMTAPLKMTLYDENGKPVELYHEAAQADEVNQARLVWHEVKKLGGKLKDWVATQPRIHPGNRPPGKPRLRGRLPTGAGKRWDRAVRRGWHRQRSYWW